MATALLERAAEITGKIADIVTDKAVIRKDTPSLDTCRPFMTTCTYASECCSDMCFLSPLLGFGLCV